MMKIRAMAACPNSAGETKRAMTIEAANPTVSETTRMIASQRTPRTVAS